MTGMCLKKQTQLSPPVIPSNNSFLSFHRVVPHIKLCYSYGTLDWLLHNLSGFLSPPVVWSLPEPIIDLKTDSCLSQRTPASFACANLCQCLRMWRCEHIIPERFGHTCQNQWACLEWVKRNGFCCSYASLFTMQHMCICASCVISCSVWKPLIWCSVLHTEVHHKTLPPLSYRIQ